MDGRVQQCHHFLIAFTRFAENSGLGSKYIRDSPRVVTVLKFFGEWMSVQRFFCDPLVLALGSFEDFSKLIRQLQSARSLYSCRHRESTGRENLW